MLLVCPKLLRILVFANVSASSNAPVEKTGSPEILFLQVDDECFKVCAEYAGAKSSPPVTSIVFPS